MTRELLEGVKSSSLGHEDKVFKSPWKTYADNKLIQTADIQAVREDKVM